MDPSKPRVAVVGRVSKDKSGEVRSVDEQLQAAEADCEANGWQIAGRYSDSVSASRFATKSRDRWPMLLADVEAGNLDIVWLWDPSRGSREPEDWFGFLRRCRVHHVMIHVRTHGRTYDMANPRDWRTMADDGVDSAYESEKKSRDVRRGLDANAANGLPHGIVKYGYRRLHDPRTGRLTGQEPHPAEAQIAAEIIRRIALSEPVSVIRDDLNARGIPGPGGGTWIRQTIRKLALSPAYIGKRYAGGRVEGRIRIGGELVPARWPAITDEATYWAAHAVLTSETRKTTRPGRVKYLLSYIMTCAACGGPCYADMPRKRRRTPLYLCASPRTHCAQVPMAEADELITLAVIAALAAPDVYPHMIAGNDEEAMSARAEATALREQLAEWARASVSPHAYRIKEEQLQPRIDAAEARARQLAVPPPLRRLTDPAADVAAVWAELPPGAQRDVIRVLFEAIRLAPGTGAAQDRITIEWRRDADI